MQDSTKSGVVLAGAVRTPIGRFGGALADVAVTELGIVAAKAALERAGLRADQVDEVVFGHARQAGGGPNAARQVAIGAGLPVDRPAYTINQACLSGFQAVLAAARAILIGEAEVVLAGGMESLSRVPYLLDARWGWRMGHRSVTDAMYRDGYLDPMCEQLMGRTAETLVDRYEIGREEQDAFAVRSHARYASALADGFFEREVVPVPVTRKGKTETVSLDEHPRADVTVASLARLKPVFREGGSVTAGNSSGVTDGAAAMVVMSDEAARRLGVRPAGRVVDWRVAGVEPELMGIGPVPAVRRLLEGRGLTLDRIDRVELNEAFAAQVLAVDRELGFDHERLNVNGGAIALGHPSGCSGARIVGTLLHELERSGGRLGLATACVSGGLGGALLIERVSGSKRGG